VLRALTGSGDVGTRAAVGAVQRIDGRDRREDQHEKQRHASHGFSEYSRLLCDCLEARGHGRVGSSRVKSSCAANYRKHGANFVAGCSGRFPQLVANRRMKLGPWTGEHSDDGQTGVSEPAQFFALQPRSTSHHHQGSHRSRTNKNKINSPSLSVTN